MNRIRFVKILSCRPVGPGDARFYDLKLGLLPFTETCQPVLLHVRRCRRCGSWVEDGSATCTWCGAPAPQGPTTRAWRREQVQLQQLGPQHPIIADEIVIPEAVDPDECLAELEAQDYDIDWEKEENGAQGY
jgi:ribosomal protein L37E